jgi:hypothetical protein
MGQWVTEEAGIGSASCFCPRIYQDAVFFSGEDTPYLLPQLTATGLPTKASVPQSKALLPLIGAVAGLGQGGGDFSLEGDQELLSGVGGAGWGPGLLTSLRILGKADLGSPQPQVSVSTLSSELLSPIGRLTYIW